MLSGVYYYPPSPGAFNGLLFKDFVLGGFEGSYWFYILNYLFPSNKRVSAVQAKPIESPTSPSRPLTHTCPSLICA